MEKILEKSVCPVCNQIFVQRDKSLGGKRKKYCSNTCRSLDWAKNNPEKEVLHRIKEKQAENYKEKRRAISRKHRLKKLYGITQNDFDIQLHRQNYKCCGCGNAIDKNTAVVDHCHKTNKFRGLLCQHCNWTLGHARDNQETLRRLMAYLDRDRSKLLVYLVGSLKLETRIPAIGNELRAEGYDVMDEWITPGREADENWQRYEKIRGRSYKEALKGRAATNIFLFDKSYIDLCDVAILTMPCGKSAFIELGYAKGRGKKTFILLDGQDPERYDIMPNLADDVCFNLEELKLKLKSIVI